MFRGLVGSARVGPDVRPVSFNPDALGQDGAGSSLDKRPPVVPHLRVAKALRDRPKSCQNKPQLQPGFKKACQVESWQLLRAQTFPGL